MLSTMRRVFTFARAGLLAVAWPLAGLAACTASSAPTSESNQARYRADLDDCEAIARQTIFPAYAQALNATGVNSESVRQFVVDDCMTKRGYARPSP
jgi:hypothetical protein